MGVLREQFQRHMRLKGFAERTLQNYEDAMVDLTRAFGVSPDTLNNEQIQSHLDRLITQKKLAWSTVNVVVTPFLASCDSPAWTSRDVRVAKSAT